MPKNPNTRYCGKCHLETLPVKHCKCGGGGSSPSGSGSDSAKKDSDKNDMTAAPSAAATQLAPANVNKADPEVIAGLIAQKVLTIDNNMDAGIFRIKINQSLLTESQRQEIQKLASAIESGFDDFVKKFGVPADKYSFDIKKDASGHIKSLKIVFSSLELYQRFYQHTLKDLLPVQQQRQVNEKHEDKKENSSSYNRPTPLPTRLERK